MPIIEGARNIAADTIDATEDAVAAAGEALDDGLGRDIGMGLVFFGICATAATRGAAERERPDRRTEIRPPRDRQSTVRSNA